MDTKTQQIDEFVNYRVEGDIALIRFNNPPVNAFSYPLRVATREALHNALADSAVRAIVLTGTHGFFSGGADISEFATGVAGDEPHLGHLVMDLCRSTKLTVAALNGPALGGGCEMALACHYRIASETAKIGLTEVTLGILPGAGGTQLLPRITGPQTAMEMIIAGKPIGATEAADKGIVDRLHAGPDVEAQAIAFARELLDQGMPPRSPFDTAVDTSGLPADFFARFRENLPRERRGRFAPERCIQCVEAACTLPFEEGMKRESALFQECANSAEARALQHLFFAERQARKVPGIGKHTPRRAIRKVAVLGAGTMGGGIAMNFVNAGIPTHILDLNADALKNGLETIRTNYQISARKGRISQQDVDARMDLIQVTTDYAAIADADLVIEAVFEDMAIKKRVFQTLDKVCKPGAILATNTSTLDVNAIAGATARPEDVIGLHFFSPANVMKLLEIVRGAKTASDVIATCVDLAGTIGKQPVVVGVCFGFVGNRMLGPYSREANRLLLEGATPKQVDRVLTGFGLAMGVVSMYDLAGIDVGYLVRESIRDELSRDPTFEVLGDRLYELGRYGQKTGRGYYRYEGRQQIEDEAFLELARRTAAEFGIERREIDDREIFERCIYPLINEGARILEDGIATRASDIDVVWTHGYGFPKWRGGPMQYADEIGLHKVLEGIDKYRAQLGEYGEMWFTPSPLLEKLVAEDKPFSAFNSVKVTL